MSQDYDAIIIGAGVIGVCTGFELAKRGYRTLNVDKQPAAGSGSTCNTCAIIRLHYSTPDGCAMARESYFYWLDWGRYLGVPDEMGLAKYVNTGCLVVKNDRNHDLVNVMAALDELHVAYEDLNAVEVAARFPWIDTRSYGPPVTMADDRFGAPSGGKIRGAVYIPESGYIDDPTLACHNVQRACEARGGEFRFGAEVVEILREGGRAAGVRLADGSTIRAPIVVNVGGPHSAIINGMAGVLNGMNISTRPLKQEVCHVPAPADMDYHQIAPLISDGDIGCYSRPTTGNHILIGSEDPECDVLEWVDDPDDYNTGFTHQWETQVMREAQRVKGLGIPGADRRTGRPLRCLRRLDPDLRQVRPAGVLHGRRHLGEPVQERAGGGETDGGADCPRGGRPRPRRRPGHDAAQVHAQDLRHRLLQPSAVAEPGFVVFGDRMTDWRVKRGSPGRTR